MGFNLICVAPGATSGLDANATWGSAAEQTARTGKELLQTVRLVRITSATRANVRLGVIFSSTSMSGADMPLAMPFTISAVVCILMLHKKQHLGAMVTQDHGDP